MRQKLPDRRANATRKVTWTTYGGNERAILVTFGFREEASGEPGAVVYRYAVAEVFCADFRAGSDTLGIVTDTCILISRLFQLGESPEALLSSMCEPYSLIGTILHAAREEEAQMQENRLCEAEESIVTVSAVPEPRRRGWFWGWCFLPNMSAPKTRRTSAAAPSRS